MTKDELIKRVNEIAEESTERYKRDGKIDYYYRVYATDWKNYGKDRTYIKVYEKRTCSKHNKLIVIANMTTDFNKKGVDSAYIL